PQIDSGPSRRLLVADGVLTPAPDECVIASASDKLVVAFATVEQIVTARKSAAPSCPSAAAPHGALVVDDDVIAVAAQRRLVAPMRGDPIAAALGVPHLTAGTRVRIIDVRQRERPRSCASVLEALNDGIKVSTWPHDGHGILHWGCATAVAVAMGPICPKL